MTEARYRTACAGVFVIQTVWRDRDALMAARDPHTPPPALALLDEVGASHSHDVLTVEVG